MTIVKPREIADLLANPHMGWQTFHRFADEDPNLAGLPSGSAYFRFYWRDLEPQEGRIGVGLLVTSVLVILRARVPWFPLHPLGYAIAPTWSMYCFWFPFFVAWTIKACIGRLGSIRTYRSGAPFMVGLILGEFTMAVFWALMSVPQVGWNAPLFPWP